MNLSEATRKELLDEFLDRSINSKDQRVMDGGESFAQSVETATRHGMMNGLPYSGQDVYFIVGKVLADLEDELYNRRVEVKIAQKEVDVLVEMNARQKATIDKLRGKTNG